MVDWRSGNALVSGAQAVACKYAYVRAKDRGFDPHIHRVTFSRRIVLKRVKKKPRGRWGLFIDRVCTQEGE